MLSLDENFRQHLEAFTSELYIYTYISDMRTETFK